MELFIADNGGTLSSTDEASLVAMLALAAGNMSESAFTDWIRGRLTD